MARREGQKHAGYEIATIESHLAPRRSVRLQAFRARGHRLLHLEVTAPPQVHAYIQLTPDEAMAVAEGCYRWAKREGEVGTPAEIVEDPPEEGPEQPGLEL